MGQATMMAFWWATATEKRDRWWHNSHKVDTFWSSLGDCTFSKRFVSNIPKTSVVRHTFSREQRERDGDGCVAVVV